MSTPKEQINCLRCRHCALLPETDFRSSLTPIYCNLKEERSPLIVSGCGLADPRIHSNPYGPRADGSSPAGDRSFYITDAEREYLRVHFYSTPEEKLCSATRRPWRELRRLARRNGLQRDPEKVAAQIRKGTAAARSLVKSPRFNEAQRHYISTCFNGDFWPRRGASVSPQGVPTQLKAQNDLIRAEIVREVAARGHAFSWDTIKNHAHEMQPGAQRWRKRWSAATRRKGVFVAPVGSKPDSAAGKIKSEKDEGGA